MDVLSALILSLVEGVSEFLPISSTGHLVLTAELLKIPQTEFVKSFEIIIQLGAIMAVVVLYWRDLLTNLETMKRIVAAFIPTSIIGLILYKFIKESLLGNDAVTLWALALGGLVMIGLELMYKEKEHHIDDTEKLSYKNAVLIGVAQSLSVIPGVSRSAATIIGGLFLGLKREAAVRFSFLLAVPTMMAATGLDLVKTQMSFSSEELMILAIGFIGSFIVALAAVTLFIKFVQKNNLIPFGIYRIVVSFLFWLLVIK